MLSCDMARAMHHGREGACWGAEGLCDLSMRCIMRDEARHFTGH